MPDWRSHVSERAAGRGLDPATEAEVVDEFVQHLEDRYRDALALGATKAEAATQALAELEAFDAFAADVTRFRQPLRPAPRPPEPSASWLAAVFDDGRWAWRRLWGSPRVTLAALVTLTLAIGANTAILGVADAVLFRPLPYADPDRVLALQMENRSTGQRSTLIPYAVTAAIDTADAALTRMGLIDSGPQVGVTGPDGPEPVPTVAVSDSYLQALGVVPARGRLIDARDAGREGRVAMLSYHAWQQRFGGDEAIVSRSVTIGDSTFDVVGVLPPAMFFPTLLAPGRPDIVTLLPPVAPDARGGTFRPIVRLAPGVSREQAQAAIEAATAPVLTHTPGLATSRPVLENIRDLLYPVGQPILRYLLVAAGLILVIGCANVANMLIVRARRDRASLAVRLALGASRTRLVRPMLFEGLFLGIAAAGLAVLATWMSFDALVRQIPPIAYGNAPVGVDGRVIVWSVAIGVGAALACSVVPAWRAAGVDVFTLLHRRGEGRGTPGAIGRPLVALQVALAIVVVFGAVIAARAFVDVLRVPLGFSTERVIRVRVSPPRGTVDLQAFYVRIAAAIAERSDVVSAAAVGAMPLSGQMGDDAARGDGSQLPVASIVHALPGYFETMRVPLERGHTFAPKDLRSDPDAAVVSASAARVMFAGRDPLGATFDNGRGRTFHVIGIVGDVRRSLDVQDERRLLPVVYVMPGASTRLLTVVAQTRDRSEATLAAIKADVHALVPTSRVNADWLDDVVTEQTAYRNPRLQTIVLGGFAGLALVVTMVGVFGVVAYLVAARVRELGIRIAMGAAPRALVALVVRQALVPVAAGIAGGLVAVHWARRFAEAQLFRVDARDPWMLAAAVMAVAAAAAMAAYVPARRATRVDPITVLRVE
jgi:predicted permease